MERPTAIQSGVPKRSSTLSFLALAPEMLGFGPATRPDVCEISWLVVIECSPKLPPRPHGSRNDRECRSPHRLIEC